MRGNNLGSDRNHARKEDDEDEEEKKKETQGD
jgi:hypothetical protein